MGLFDNLKNVFGGKKDEGITASTKGPSQILRENGIDVSGLKFSFGSAGVVGASGTMAQAADRQKIIDLLEATHGIDSVTDNMTVVVAPEPEPEPEAAPEVELAPPAADSSEPAAEASDSTEPAEEGDSYTVQSGDTLWKIASSQYGDGSKYMKIFEANTDLLENPDRIFPGQKLAIPKLED
jgi:nucleoid-associated protein YgaU